MAVGSNAVKTGTVGLYDAKTGSLVKVVSDPHVTQMMFRGISSNGRVLYDNRDDNYWILDLGIALGTENVWRPRPEDVTLACPPPVVFFSARRAPNGLRTATRRRPSRAARAPSESRPCPLQVPNWTVIPASAFEYRRPSSTPNGLPNVRAPRDLHGSLARPRSRPTCKSTRRRANSHTWGRTGCLHRNWPGEGRTPARDMAQPRSQHCSRLSRRHAPDHWPGDRILFVPW